MCETHDFHNFLDTSTLVTKKLYGLYMLSRDMHGSDIYLHSGKNYNFLLALNYFCTRLGPKFSQYVTFSDKYQYMYSCMWLWGETDYVSSYDMWRCPQLHVDRPGCSNPCRCQLCQTVRGIYLTVNSEDSMKKKLQMNLQIFPDRFVAAETNLPHYP